MATKKQKREAALAKRDEFLAEEKTRGLEALEADRRNKARAAELIREASRETNERYMRILTEATPEDWAAARASIGE
jgi:hypothetical protein